jgi:hypothetical protein
LDVPIGVEFAADERGQRIPLLVERFGGVEVLLPRQLVEYGGAVSWNK